MSGRDPAIEVVASGLLTTVQDLGRWGHQHLGVSVSGAMDPVAHRRANRLVGNPETAATLEVTLVGPTLRVTQPVRLAVCGASFELRLDDFVVSIDTVLAASGGQTLAFGRRLDGARAYVALAGGISVPPVLGSRSTHVGSGMGGLAGRPLVAGDRIAVEPAAGTPTRPVPAEKWRRASVAGGARVRVLPGPHTPRFDPETLERLAPARYRIRPDSDRMGYRLEGDPIPCRDADRLLSQALPLGAVQILPSGDAIIAMADRQTTGGYPRVATVISADVPRLGQLGPGDWVEFVACDPGTAREALMQMERDVTG